MGTLTATTQADRHALERLLSESEAAKYLGCQPYTMRRWRVTGGGPKFVRIGRLVRYRPSDIVTFVEAGVRNSTSEIVGNTPTRRPAIA